MSRSYTYNPDAWHPVLAGSVAGAIAAIVAGLISLVLRSPDEVIANSLTVVLVSIVFGLLAGGLWRRLRETDNAEKVFSWSMVGGFFVVAAAIALTDLFALSNMIKYAGPLAVVIFLTLGFFVPMLSRVTAPVWVAAIPIVIALVLGVGLFGRGNVASGELSLDDLETPTSETTEAVAGDTTTEAPTETVASTVPGTVPPSSELAASYDVESGISTYSVEETLNGLSTQGVGETESVDGKVVPGGAFVFSIDLQSFTSDQRRRDSKVEEWFAEFPLGTFEGDSFDLPDPVVVGEIVTMIVPGTMTVNTIERPAEWTVEARLETNSDLSLQGETDIVLSDFDIPVISSGFVTMEDAARIEVLLVMTSGA